MIYTVYLCATGNRCNHVLVFSFGWDVQCCGMVVFKYRAFNLVHRLDRVATEYTSL